LSGGRLSAAAGGAVSHMSECECIQWSPPAPPPRQQEDEEEEESPDAPDKELLSSATNTNIPLHLDPGMRMTNNDISNMEYNTATLGNERSNSHTEATTARQTIQSI